MSLLFRFGVKPNTENIVSFEHNDLLKGTELLGELILTSSSCHPRKISHPIFLNENAIFEQPLVWEYESAILLSFFRVTQSANQGVDYQILTRLLQKSDEVRKKYGETSSKSD